MYMHVGLLMYTGAIDPVSLAAICGPPARHPAFNGVHRRLSADVENAMAANPVPACGLELVTPGQSIVGFPDTIL
jgi:hypothetical protein